jgi:ADP-heptose:LPS heptosyltransferase
MSKPQWLKTTYIKTKFSHSFASLLKKKHFPSQRGVLITSTDGLGDAFMRLSIVYRICQNYGFDKVWILSKPLAVPLYKTLGIQTITYTDKNRTNPLRRLSLVNYLNKLPINKVIALEFTRNENLIELIEQNDKTGFSHNLNPENNSQLSTIVANPGYVGDALNNMCQELNIKVNLMDNTELFKNIPAAKKQWFATSDNKRINVIIAVGASARERMMRTSNLSQIMDALYVTFPNIDFLLAGTGKRDEKYTKLLLSKYKGNNVQTIVSQTSILETVDIVANCDLLIGFDSGIYNLAFTLKKPTLCFASDNENALHQAPWLKVIRGTDKKYGESDGYGGTRTNSIYSDIVVAQFKELIDLYWKK